jgi:hypothetical protein
MPDIESPEPWQAILPEVAEALRRLAVELEGLETYNREQAA